MINLHEKLNFFLTKSTSYSLSKLSQTLSVHINDLMCGIKHINHNISTLGPLYGLDSIFGRPVGER